MDRKVKRLFPPTVQIDGLASYYLFLKRQNKLFKRLTISLDPNMSKHKKYLKNQPRFIRLGKDNIRSLVIHEQSPSHEVLNHVMLFIKYCKKIKKIDYLVREMKQLPLEQRKKLLLLLYKMNYPTCNIHLLEWDQLSGGEVSIYKTKRRLLKRKETEKNKSLQRCNRKELGSIVLTKTERLRPYFNPKPIKFLDTLTQLRLDFPSLPLGFQTIFGPMEENKLTNLSLIFDQVQLTEDQYFPNLISLLEKLKKLQALELKTINVHFFTANGQYLTRLFEKISNLKSLESLILHFQTKRSLLPKYNFSKIGLYFTDILRRPNHAKGPSLLNRFSLYFNQLDPKTEFCNMLEHLEPTVSTLKELKLDFGKCEPDDAKLMKIQEFVENLTNIQTLRFIGLNISEECFVEILRILVRNARNLENLTLGIINRVRKSVTRELIISTITELLRKPGMTQIFFRFSRDLKNYLLEDEALNKIDLKRIKERNISLKKVPDDIPIFINSNIL